MRKLVVPVIPVLFILMLFGSAFVSAGKAHGPDAKENVVQDFPNSRCTRLSYGPLTRKSAPSTPDSLAMPGTRCSRLTTGPRKGAFLPNTPPKVGLSSSTSYVGTTGGSEVQLDTIACDLDGDTLLYTYSTTGGRIGGEGPNAVWSLAGVGPGAYTVSVEVDDGCGCLSFVSRVVTVGG